jgi:hypothetical protein
VVQVFVTDIVHLHDIPQSIVSDWDPVFTSIFWKELMRLASIKLHMTSAFHPQSDGQTEVANKIIVMYCNKTDQIIRAQVQKQAPKRSNFQT